jgi:hypothetical protein
MYQPMYNYVPFVEKTKKSGSFLLYFILFLFFVIAIVIGIVYYRYYTKIENNNNQNLNLNNLFTNIDTNLNLSESSENLCDNYTQDIQLDLNNPEYGGHECIKNFILQYGTKINDNFYILNYTQSGNLRYSLDLSLKVILFYDTNGILIEDKFCRFTDPDDSGCITN